MLTENTINAEFNEARGWIFYDADCVLCVRIMRRVRRLFETRGFHWLPLQSPGAAARLGVNEIAFATRMHVLTQRGGVFHNADALGILCRSVWWLWPLGVLLLVPGFRGLARLGYDWIARHRYCLGGQCARRPVKQRSAGVVTWIPAVLLPILAWLCTRHLPAWLVMWALAFALFAGCKWATCWEAFRAGLNPSGKRILGYIFVWPGMNAQTFFDESKAFVVASNAWAWGLANLIGGAALVWGIVPQLIDAKPMLAGWLGMFGLALMLHFGLFALLAWAWRRVGVNATPIMQTPVAATSLSEFWGTRWNTAFHQLANRYVFRPLARRVGVRMAAMVVFLTSGLIHDLVISVPAHAGYGLPTLYFAIQGLGVRFERTGIARKLGLGNGLAGWLFTMAVTVGPAALLFHPKFVHHVIVPFLRALGA